MDKKLRDFSIFQAVEELGGLFPSLLKQNK